MAIKKNNVISVNLTQKNLIFLQNLGFLNKRKKSRGFKNISEFVNRGLDFFRENKFPSESEKVEEDFLLYTLAELGKKKDKTIKEIKNDMRRVAIKLAEVREANKLIIPEGPDISDSEPLLTVEVDSN